MTIYTKFEINETEYDDIKDCFVKKNLSSGRASSNFIIKMDSPYGRYKDNFNIGDDIIIYVSDSSDIGKKSSIAHYKFNDNSSDDNVLDFNGNHNGILNGGNNTEDISEAGKINRALHFDGSSDYVKVDYDSELYSDEMTFSFWVKSDKSNYAVNGVVIGMWDYSNNNRQWNILIGSGDDKYKISVSNDGSASETLDTNISVDTDWHHFAFVVDNNAKTWDWYYDGEKQTTITATKSYTNQNSFLVIGNLDGGSFGFDGLMDDVRLYNSKLSTTEIEEIYNSGSGSEDYIMNGVIFRGILEKIRLKGKENTEILELSGRDYSARMQDTTVEPIVFTDTEVSSIVTTLMNSSGIDDVTTSKVDTTTTTLKRISFNHKTLFDAIQELGELSGFQFYVDEFKNLHFEKEKTKSSGVIFDKTNLLDVTFDKSRKEMVNKVWIYGDRYLSGFKQLINADGGSSYTLSYKPHNIDINYLGSSLIGAVKEMSITQTSGPDYLVSFYDKEILFQSGTDIGYNSIPTSGGSFITSYQRELPIVKYGQDDNSINLYGPKTYVFVDKSIRDPSTALDILRAKLKESDPLNRVRCKVYGWFDLTLGDNVGLNIDNFNIQEDEMAIIEIKYNLNKKDILNNKFIEVTLSKKFLDITDRIKLVEERLNKIEAEDLQDSDILTRLITDIPKPYIVGSIWKVSERNISGNVLIWGHPDYGEWNDKEWGSSKPGTNTVIFSGGYNY
ncbi:MAG: LamG-like jellyroll fold domain-containing protein [Promethearchaeota archaeon]